MPPVNSPNLSGFLCWTQDRIQRGMMEPVALTRATRTLRLIPRDQRALAGKLSPRLQSEVVGKLRVFEADLPQGLRDANAFVLEYHRHHQPVTGCRFIIGVRDDERVRGYAIVSRPVAQMLDPDRVIEVTRVATDGARNACSMLYGAVRRKALALNREPRLDRHGKPARFERVITYTLPEEGGASLRAAGWAVDGRTAGGSWSRDSRPRNDEAPTGPKTRWAISL